MQVDKNRIVVTGLGVVSAIGSTTERTWNAATAGESGIGEIASLQTGWLGTRYAGEVRDLDLAQFLDEDEQRDLVRSAQLVIAASHEALDQSKLDLDAYDPYRIGLVLGTCQGSLAELNLHKPHIIDAVHASCDALGRHLGLRGPRAMASTACSAGATALGMARDRLLAGDADVVITGGTDALTFFSLSGFAIMGALAPGPCAPYSRSDGLSLGEGAAVLVLEPLDGALERGAPILAELLGCGLSADAYHASAPDPSGRGAALAVKRALAQAGVTPEDVDYVNGHGTATPANDAMERKAMRIMFGDRAPRVPWSSTKSMIGHTLGAAGAIETGMCILATQNDMVPPTVNFGEGAEQDFDFVPNTARRHPVEVAISNSYGFGGTNASVVVSKPGREVDPTLAPNHTAVVTGIGVVGPLGIGVDDWWAALAAGECAIGEISAFDAGGFLGADVPPLPTKGFAHPGAWRKMDMLARQCVASSRLAWRHAGIDLDPNDMENVAVLFGTNAGSMEHTETFDRGARQGAAKANPILFPNAVLNSAAGQVCMTLGLRGPTNTVTSGGVSGLVSLIQALDLIGQGEVDVALVLGGDSLYRTVVTAGGAIPGMLTTDCVRPFDERASGTGLAGCGAAILLESTGHAEQRGAVAHARLQGWGMTSDASPDALPGSSSDFAAAMRLAVERSGLRSDDIGLVVAAASGVAISDRAEAQAIGEVVGSSTPVTAPKSLTGETLGGAGLVGAVTAMLALERGQLAPTANLSQPLGDVPLAHVLEPTTADVRHCLVNAVGIGGNYVSVVLGRGGDA